MCIKPWFNFLVYGILDISMLFINLNCLYGEFCLKDQAIYDFYISVEEACGLSRENKRMLTFIY